METSITQDNPQRAGELQLLVYNLLAQGGKYSVADIAVALHLSDPRGHIAKLRNKGYNICDEWRTSDHGSRYKVYFVPEEAV